MAKRYDQFCPIAHALSLVGERWSLLVVRELLKGPRRYTDLAAGLPGIGTNILATRLRELRAAGAPIPLRQFVLDCVIGEGASGTGRRYAAPSISSCALPLATSVAPASRALRAASTMVGRASSSEAIVQTGNSGSSAAIGPWARSVEVSGPRSASAR